MTKLKFAYTVAGLAISVWNAGRLIAALRDQSDEIAEKVVQKTARTRFAAARDGNALKGVARDVFRELRYTRAKPTSLGADAPILPIDEQMLCDALTAVAGRVLA